MSVNTLDYMKSYTENVEIFKFFEKTVKTSPKSSKVLKTCKKLRPIVLYDRSKIKLLDGEYDITKEVSDSAQTELEMSDMATKPTNSNPRHVFSKRELNGQEMEKLQFVEKYEKQKASKTATKNEINTKLPQRRSTRLKSQISADSLRHDLLYGEHDISNNELGSSKSEFGTPEKKTKLSISNPNNNRSKIEKRDKKNSSRIELITQEVESYQVSKETQKLKALITKRKSTIPHQRRTRLKSEVLVDNFRSGLHDITKKDLESSKSKIETLEKTLSKTNSEVEDSKTLHRTELALNNTLENIDQNNVFKDMELITQEMADNLIKTIDSNVIVSMLKHIDVEKDSANCAKQRKQTNQTLDNILYENKACEEKDKSTENVSGKNGNDLIESKTKTVQAKSCNHISSNNDTREFTNLNKRNSRRNVNKKSTCKKLYDENLLSNTSNDADNNLGKSAETSVQPKKRARKAISLNNSNIIPNIKSDKVKSLNVQKDQLNEVTSRNNENILLNPKLPPNSSSSNNNVAETDIIEKSCTLSGRTRSSRKAKQTSIKNKSSANNKKEKSQPNKKTTSELVKQQGSKVKLSKKPAIKKYTKISKLTKEQIKNVNTRKIPKDRLTDVLDMIDNDRHPIWEDRNRSCNPYIYLHWEHRASSVSDQNMKIKYARQFLLRREWNSLSKILCLTNSSAKTYYPLLSKYATLLLAHTDKEQFDKFIQFLIHTNDSSTVIKKCTKI